MFIVFDCKNAPYLKTWDEVEADTTAAQIGGYYVESSAYQNGGRSWQQVRALDKMEVILEEDNGKTLIVENC